MRVKVYRNLRDRCWSVVDRATGRVAFHAASLVLSGVTFKVGKGRERALKSGQRNVHAYACGDLEDSEKPLPGHGYRLVTYNPFRCGAFTLVLAGTPVSSAPRAVFTPGRVWVPSKGVA